MILEEKLEIAWVLRLANRSWALFLKNLMLNF